MIFRGFNFGIDFEGGNSFRVPGTSEQLDRDPHRRRGGRGRGRHRAGGRRQHRARCAPAQLDTASETAVKDAVAKAAGVDPEQVSPESVSADWGSDITDQALIALVVFLVAVVAFLALRFEPKMAVGAMVALLHDLILTAGIYSLVGFEVTPSTVIGFLTILGFSLYDTVVVFDKVDENTKDLERSARMTYGEAANLAVNQTLMRSINTSVIALLPVAGLLFVGAGLLGVGTLKDLALVLFVGLAAGAYSSIFLATPIVADLKEREPEQVALHRRVLARRSAAERPGRCRRRGRPGRQRPSGAGRIVGRRRRARAAAVRWPADVVVESPSSVRREPGGRRDVDAAAGRPPAAARRRVGPPGKRRR